MRLARFLVMFPVLQFLVPENRKPHKNTDICIQDTARENAKILRSRRKMMSRKQSKVFRLWAHIQHVSLKILKLLEDSALAPNYYRRRFTRSRWCCSNASTLSRSCWSGSRRNFNCFHYKSRDFISTPLEVLWYFQSIDAPALPS